MAAAACKRTGAVGTLPGQRQNPLPDGSRTARTGVQMLLPQPQIPLQTRTGPAAFARPAQRTIHPRRGARLAHRLAGKTHADKRSQSRQSRENRGRARPRRPTKTPGRALEKSDIDPTGFAIKSGSGVAPPFPPTTTKSITAWGCSVLPARQRSAKATS